MAQTSDANLTTAANVIKNETTALANTASRVGTMLNNIIDSKINNENISTSIPTDTGSDAKVPSVEAVEEFVATKLPYKKYLVSMTQTGTGAPIVGATFQDDITGIVWTYASTGTFTGTKTGAFLSGKVPKKIGLINAFYSSGSAYTYVYEISRQTDNTITLVTRNLTVAGGTNDLLNADTIEFVVYD